MPQQGESMDKIYCCVYEFSLVVLLHFIYLHTEHRAFIPNVLNYKAVGRAQKTLHISLETIFSNFSLQYSAFLEPLVPVLLWTQATLFLSYFAVPPTDMLEGPIKF